MNIYAIAAESSGPFPNPGYNNWQTELVALRIVKLGTDDSKPERYYTTDEFIERVYSRSDGGSVQAFNRIGKPLNSTTDEMVRGKQPFCNVARNLIPFINHKDANGNYDRVFFCFGEGFYHGIFERYGIYREGMFFDLLPAVRDGRARECNISMMSNAPGDKLPSIPEVAEFLGFDMPEIPTLKHKTDLLCEVLKWNEITQQQRADLGGGLGVS